MRIYTSDQNSTSSRDATIKLIRPATNLPIEQVLLKIAIQILLEKRHTKIK